MRKLSAIVIAFLTIMITMSTPVQAQSEVVTINYLIDHAKELDGTTVTIQGEAIGERMDRGDYSWVNINDGSNATGIWMAKSVAEQISFYGDYTQTGDELLVTGTFYRACVEHGGEADIHLDTLKIVSQGYFVNRQVPGNKLILAGTTVACGLVVGAISIPRLKKKNRNRDN